MNETQPRGRAIRSARALFAGFFFIVVLSTVTDLVLHSTGVFPPPGQSMSDALFALALAYRIVYGVLGCWIAARFAPDRPMRHALSLGAVGLVLSTVGAVVMWSAGPAWYPIALIATTMPCAWAGVKLHTMRSGAGATGGAGAGPGRGRPGQTV